MIAAPDEGQPGETKPFKVLSPGTTISHYRIMEKIGQGGMGVVYKAEDMKLRRTVALKFLPPYLTEDPHARERFVHEAQAASALDHHNICTIHEIDETEDGHTFISMACYEGETLRERMERGPLDLDEVLGIGLQILEGLTKAHSKGIIHRDLKPANIMVTDDGVAKIMDFGLAKLAGRTRITRTGTTMGTPAYMSPEQAQGGEVDQRSDIFSLGVILYEMTAGRPPFKGNYEAAVLHSILHDEPEPLSDSRTGVPAQLQRIVDRALEKDAGKRYQTTSGLRSDLARLREETRTAVTGRPRKPLTDKSFIIPAIAVIAIVVAYIAFSLFDREGSSEQPSGLVQDDLFTIVVAPFWGATDEAAEEGKVMQGLIERQLRDELGGETDVRILSDAVSETPRSEEDATVLGRDLDATLVIWGEVFSLHGEVEIQPYLTYVSYDWLPMNPFTPALETDLSQPSQLAQRRAKAEEVGNMGLLAAGFYYSRRDRDKALAVLGRIKPRSTMSILAEAWVEFFSDRRAEAESLCFEAATLDTLDPRPYNILGALYSELGRHDEAITNLEKAFASAPDQEEFRWQLALAYARNGDERALALYREVVDGKPESSRSHGRFGWLCFELGRFDDAIKEHKLAIRLEPKDHWAYFRLGIAYEATDSLSRAVVTYGEGRNVAESNEDRSVLSWHLGRIYRSQGKHEEAISEFKKAIALRPTYPNAYFLLMSSYESLGRGEEGLRFIQEAAEAHPEEGLLHHILGNAYRSLGRPTEAVAAYKEALRLSPDNGDTYNALGQAYAQLDSLDLAASCFRAASHLGIRWIRRSWPHLLLAHVNLLRGMPEDAENEIMKAVEIDPGFSQAYATLGLAYAYQDRYGEAVGEFKKAIELTPDVVYWDLFYALLLHKVGRAEEGRAHLRQLADSFDGDPWAKSVIGFLTGSVNEATLLSLTKSDKPTTEREHKCEAYYYTGMAYLLDTDAELESRHPDTAKAQHYFEQCLSSSIWGYFEPVFAQTELARLDAK